MVQIKVAFGLFSIIVLGLWIGHLYRLSPSLSERAVASAATEARLAPLALQVKIDQRRRELWRVASKAVDGAAIAAFGAGRARAEAPSAERFLAVRSAIQENLTEGQRLSWIFAVANEQGELHAKGLNQPTADKAALDVSALVPAGSDGAWREAYGSLYLFFAFPARNGDKSDPKPSGYLVLGAPVAVQGLLDSAAKELNFLALALIRAGKVVGAAGERQAWDEIQKRAQVGGVAVVEWGTLAYWGPFKLPFLTSSRTDAGAPLSVASRQLVAGTPYELMGVVSLSPFMQALADYQRRALWGFVALVILSLFWVLVSELVSTFREERHEEGVSPQPTPQPQGFSTEGASASALPLFPPAERPPPDSLAPPQVTSEYLGPDATRVATIPEELLRASAAPFDEEPPPPLPPPPPSQPVAPTKPPPAPAAPAVPTDDEAHFQAVFREFVATREQCGESSDGLTYERFANKLRKNREQLIQKYGCRTVRFQVYVKDGKAALRATPVRS